LVSVEPMDWNGDFPHHRLVVGQPRSRAIRPSLGPELR